MRPQAHRARTQAKPAKSEEALQALASSPHVAELAAAAVAMRAHVVLHAQRAVAPQRGTQWIPHSHVQSTQPRGATHNQSASTQTRRIDRSPRPSYPLKATSSLRTVNEAALQQVSAQQLLKSSCSRSISMSAKPRPSKATLPPAPSAQEAERVPCCSSRERAASK